MTVEAIGSDVSKRQDGADAGEGKGATAKNSLAQTAIAVLASSGVITVLGPLLGQMYWDGYLSAFGLTPEEFPAADAEVRRYAYVAVVLGVDSLWSALVRLWWLPCSMTVIASVFVALSQTRLALRMRVGLRRLARNVASRKTFLWHAARGSGFAMLYAISVALVVLVLMCAVTVIVSPLFARQAGLSEGRKDVASYARAAVKGAANCAVLRSAPQLKCARVVVTGKDTLAVLDEGRIHRVARSQAELVTALPVGTIKAE